MSRATRRRVSFVRAFLLPGKWHSLRTAAALAFAIGMTAALSAPCLAQSTTYTWDYDGSGVPTDGSGTWNTTSPDWYLSGTDYDWTNSTTAANSVIFGDDAGAAGTVTISGTVDVQNITFDAASSGYYTLSGGTIDLGTPTAGPTTTATITVNTNATISSIISDKGTSTTVPALAVTGAGTLTLSGNLSLGTATDEQGHGGSAASLFITSNGVAADNGTTVSITAGTDALVNIVVGAANSSNTLSISGTAAINLSGGEADTFILGGDGTSSGEGVVNQSGGSVTLTSTNLSATQLVVGKYIGAYGNYNLSSTATLSTPNIYIGADSASGLGYGIFAQSGGTVTVTYGTYLGWNNPASTASDTQLSVGELYVTGGTFNQTGAAGIIAGNAYNQYGTGGALGVITVAGSGNLTVSAGSITLGSPAAGYTSLTTGILNLDGGTTTVNSIATSTTVAGSTSILNFNGGTLKANATSSAFITGLSQANVFPGGAVFSITSGQTLTVPQLLRAPSGYGVTSIPIATGASGYIGSPIVEITGGGGTGATAVATVSGGSVTGITITSPGTGYTSAPMVTLVGGGSPTTGAILGTVTTAATLGTVTTAPNTSGGLTLAGGGTLILSDATGNTYLIGEKYLNADSYATGTDLGDNENVYTGLNWDCIRTAATGESGGTYEYQPPKQDTPGLSDYWTFGSAHFGVFNMSFCDGSVRGIGYNINPETHRRLANRSDGLPVDPGSL